MTEPFVVGLTGPTGSGKSTVAQILVSHGYRLIDADQLSRRVVEPGTPCLKALTRRFSEAILRPDGSLDRRVLAKAAFSSPEATAELNAIVHPAVLALIDQQLALAAADDVPVILDAPLLFESGLGARCCVTVAVLAPDGIRRGRICERDSLTAEQADRRMNTQPENDYYCDRATVLLSNGGTLEQLHAAAQNLFRQLERWRGIEA